MLRITSLCKGIFFLLKPVGICVLSFTHISRLWMNVIPLATVPDWDWSCSGWQHVLLFLFHWIPNPCQCLAHIRPLKFDSLSPCTPARFRINNDSRICAKSDSEVHLKNLWISSVLKCLYYNLEVYNLLFLYNFHQN